MSLFFIRYVTGDHIFKVVDLYNGATGAWTTAQLSVARDGLTATSVGNVAIFAGGYTGWVPPLMRVIRVVLRRVLYVR